MEVVRGGLCVGEKHDGVSSGVSSFLYFITASKSKVTVMDIRKGVSHLSMRGFLWTGAHSSHVSMAL